MKNGIVLLMLAVAGLFLYSCTKKNDTTTAGNAHVTFRLTDDPANYDAVNIEIKEIQVHYAADTSAAGWQTIPLINPGVYNLLDLRNGLDTLLASVDLPTGKISQIRMVLGDNNSVVIDNMSSPLKTPSAQESGLKLNLDQTLEAGLSYVLYLDFDAERSVVEAGQSGKFILKPVIRAYAATYGGAIKGVVLPDSAQPYVLGTMNGDSVSTMADADGNYLLSGLAAGSWNLYFAPRDTSYQAANINNVSVTSGQVDEVDTLRLMKK